MSRTLTFTPKAPPRPAIPDRNSTIADKLQWFALEEPHVIDTIHGQVEYILEKRRRGYGAPTQKGGAR